MEGMTVKDLFEAASGNVSCTENVLLNGKEELYSEEITDVVTDSREIVPGCVFIAIKGEHSDGHDYIADVYDKGALVCIGTRGTDEEPIQESLKRGSRFYIQVNDSVEALARIASAYIKILGTPIVGITGSVGKTSTKEAIASVLKQRFNIAKTPGNNNNLIGLPLTCFTFDKSTEIGVVEMGISMPGEMDKLTEIIQPTVAIMTNIGIGHIEMLGSREGVFNEKRKILDKIKPEGLAIVNGDDDMLCNITEAAGKPVIQYRINSDCESGKAVYADDIKDCGFEGTDFTINNILIQNRKETIRTHMPIPGRHMIYSAIAAACVGAHFGLTSEEIDKGIRSIENVAGRSNVIKSKDGIVVIDDCYNANPVSMKAAVDMLLLGKGRKICVLGDMGELGETAEELHKDVGSYIAERKIDALFTVGDMSKAMAEVAKDKNCNLITRSFDNNEAAIEEITEFIKSGDNVLVKASNYMKFSDIVKSLTD